MVHEFNSAGKPASIAAATPTPQPTPQPTLHLHAIPDRDSDSSAPLSHAADHPHLCDSPRARDELTRAQKYEDRVDAVTNVLLTPGHYVLPSDCVDDVITASAAIKQSGVPRTLVIAPSQHEAITMAVRLREHELDAKVYPRRDKKTCKIWDQGPSTAAAAGIPVGVAFCANCEYSKAGNYCEFMRLRAEAVKAPHLFMNARRASLEFTKHLDDRKAAVLVRTSPLDVMCPTRDFHLGAGNDGPRDPKWVSHSLQLLSEAGEVIIPRARRPDWGDGFWGRVRDIIHGINDTLLGCGVGPIALPTREDVICDQKYPNEWVQDLWAVLKERRLRPNGELTQLIISAATGKLNRLDVFADAMWSEESDRRMPAIMPTSGYLVGIAQLKMFPEDVAVVALCKASASDLRSGTGVTWHTLQAPAIGPMPDQVKQAAQRITIQSSPGQILGIVRLHLLKNSGHIGIVAYQGLVRNLKNQMKKEKWQPADSERVHMIAWADDATELAPCATVLVFGAPRPHRIAVFRRLLQMDDPAAFEKPRWGEFADFEVNAPNGQRLLMSGHAYGHPRWRQVDGELLHEVLNRLLSQVTCPVMVYADEPLDLPVVGSTPAQLRANWAVVLNVLKDEVALLETANRERRDAAATDVGSVSSAVREGIQSETLASLLGKKRRTIQTHLATLNGQGLASRIDGGSATTWVPTDDVKDQEHQLDKLSRECRAVLECLVAQTARLTVKTDILSTPLLIKGVGKVSVLAANRAVSLGRLVELTKLPEKTVARYLRHLADLGEVTHVGRGPKSGWTTFAAAFPETTTDPRAEAAYNETHPAHTPCETADGPAFAQGTLPFITAALREQLLASEAMQAPTAPVRQQAM